MTATSHAGLGPDSRMGSMNPNPNPGPFRRAPAEALTIEPAPSSLPYRATPMPGEAAASVLLRHATGNGISYRGLVDRLGLRSFFVTRTMTATQTKRVACYFSVDPANVRDSTLTGLPSEIVGEANPRAATADPVGWSLMHWSARCLECHATRQPWLTLHQTGLVWSCEQHRTYLTAICGLCCPPAELVTRPHLRCHMSDYPRAVTAADLRNQITVASRVARANPSDIAWLRNLRALTVFVALESAITRDIGRPPSRQAALVTRSRPVLGRLDRPDPDPRRTAALVHVALRHLTDDGNFDKDWVERVCVGLDRRDDLKVRLAPFRRQLGLLPEKPTPVPAAAPLPPWTMHPRWQEVLSTTSAAVRAAGLEPANVPAALLDSNQFTGDVVSSIVPAVALRMVAFRHTCTRAAFEFGASNGHITRVRDHLRVAPSPRILRRFEQAVDRLCEDVPVDYSTLRVQQGFLSKVSGITLREFGLTPPEHGDFSQGHVAALWLWTIVTRSHPTLAPHADGRQVRPLLPRLQRWHAEAPPHGLAALLEWNAEHVLDVTAIERLAGQGPDTTTSTEPTGSGNEVA